MMSSRRAESANPALRLAALRRLHVYVGVLIAPSILFFAFTGALQLFTLHEAHGDYRPPALIEKLSMLHKDQVFAAKPKRPRPQSVVEAAPKPEAKVPGKVAPKVSALALKWWFLLVASGLVASTLLGLWMALRYHAQKRLLWLLVLIGAAIPFGLPLI